MKKLFVGADPGSKGALAFIDGQTLIADAINLQQTEDKELDVCWVRGYLKDRFKGYDLVALTLEKVNGDPSFGANFVFGKNYGMLKSQLHLLVKEDGMRLILAQPKQWKKIILSNTKQDKAAAITYIQQLYPMCNLIPDRCRTISDDRAEACCLAEYSRRIIEGK